MPVDPIKAGRTCNWRLSRLTGLRAWKCLTILTVTPSGASTVARFRPIELSNVSHVLLRHGKNSPESSLGSCIVASIDTTSSTSNASNEDDATPALGAHAWETSLGDHKLTPSIHLHHFVPVVLLNILDIADTFSDASVGNKNGHCGVPSSHFTMAQHIGNKCPRGITVREVCSNTEESLLWK
jgi:hypothetical protein